MQCSYFLTCDYLDLFALVGVALLKGFWAHSHTYSDLVSYSVLNHVEHLLSTFLNISLLLYSDFKHEILKKEKWTHLSCFNKFLCISSSFSNHLFHFPYVHLFKTNWKKNVSHCQIMSIYIHFNYEGRE